MSAVETIAVPASLVRAAMEALVPHGEESIDVSRTFLQVLAEEVEETEPICDHSVGICACSEAATLAELNLYLDGKMTCPDCHGEGFQFSREKMDAAITKFCETNAIDRRDAHNFIGEEAGNVACGRCETRGVVPVEASA